jgi:hypothetical protein
VLAYDFSKNCQSGGKHRSKLRISWSRPQYCKSVIYNGLIFQFLRVLKNFTFFARNPKVLAYGFAENCQFGAKTDRNSVFLGRDRRIANWLSVTVPYFNFYGFWKISHFCSKSKGVSLRFLRKLLVWGKNWPKLCISWSWPLYCELVMYNRPVFQFLWVLKNFTFLQEIQRC